SLVAPSARADAKLAAEVARTNAFIATSGTTPTIFDIGSASQPCWRRMGLRTTFQPLADRWANVPFPCYFQPADGTDGEAVILDQARATTYEFWSARYNDPAFPWRGAAPWGGAGPGPRLP